MTLDFRKFHSPSHSDWDDAAAAADVSISDAHNNEVYNEWSSRNEALLYDKSSMHIAFHFSAAFGKIHCMYSVLYS